MELTGKQRAALRSMCNTLQPVLYIGKEGVTEATVKEAYDAIEARELIKCSIQKSVDIDTRSMCDALCEAVHADGVQCIGRKFVIYRRARQPEKRKIQLPR